MTADWADEKAIQVTLESARITIAANPEMRGKWLEVKAVVAAALRTAERRGAERMVLHFYSRGPGSPSGNRWVPANNVHRAAAIRALPTAEQEQP